MNQQLWKHKKNHKGKLFFANYEYNKSSKRVVKFKNVMSGLELKAYSSLEAAKKDGWSKV